MRHLARVLIFGACLYGGFEGFARDLAPLGVALFFAAFIAPVFIVNGRN